MRCSHCGYLDSKVIDSRPLDGGISIRRRRECLNCGKRFTTYESIEIQPIVIIKRDGRRENFDPIKLKKGLLKACEKSSVSMSDIDNMIVSITKTLTSSAEIEFNSSVIGELIMKELKAVNEVAYLRFVCVYREFKDVNAFLKELESLNVK